MPLGGLHGLAVEVAQDLQATIKALKYIARRIN
jgi:hypothetical protein